MPAMTSGPPGEPPMSLATALTRVDWVLARYEGCGSTVLRVMSAADMDAVKVIADTARRHATRPAAKEGTASDRLF
jgi:hypothetical protein